VKVNTVEIITNDWDVIIVKKHKRRLLIDDDNINQSLIED
jgi:hypothetical protein